jgi:predicted nuclease with TOPRIM domain
MTQQQFEELKSLIRVNADMIGLMYEDHGARLTRVEVRQEQFSDDLRGVADGVKGNTERLEGLEGRFDRLEGRFDHLEGRFDHLDARFDGFEVSFQQLSDSVTTGFAEHEQRLGALED